MANHTKGKARLVGGMQKLRAMAMLQRKIISGKSNKELAKEFNVHHETIERNLLMAKQSGLLEQFEQQLLETLASKAMKAVENALDENDAQVALEILKGAGILKKTREVAKPIDPGDGDDLEMYLRVRNPNAINGRTTNSLPPKSQAQLEAADIQTSGPINPQSPSADVFPAGLRSPVSPLDGPTHQPQVLLDGELVEEED